MTRRPDVYQLVTDRLVSLLEGGTAPWRKTWKATDVPRSLSTGKAYKGLNVFVLMGTAMAEGYSSPYWGTFKAVKDRGGSVRKGEKATPVVFWKFIDSKETVRRARRPGRRREPGRGRSHRHG